MNIVLHAFDSWMEEHWQAHAPVPHRTHPEYARLKRSLTRWRGQLQGRIPRGRQTVEGLRHKIADAKAARPHGPSDAPRQTLSFCRFADDYLVGMGGYGKADAQRLKEAMATWLQDQLGLRQHPEKTGLPTGVSAYVFWGMICVANATAMGPVGHVCAFPRKLNASARSGCNGSAGIRKCQRRTSS
jgi:hypothetical protein